VIPTRCFYFPTGISASESASSIKCTCCAQVNDGALLNDVPAKRGEAALSALRQRLVAASEVLLRRLLALPTAPAVVFVEAFSYDGRPDPSSRAHAPPSAPTLAPPSGQSQQPAAPSLGNATCGALNGRGFSLPDARHRVLDAYGVPRVSVRDAVLPSLDCPLPRLGSQRAWVCANTCHHPTAPSHGLIASLVAALLLKEPKEEGFKEEGPKEEGSEEECASEDPHPATALTPGAAELEVRHTVRLDTIEARA